MNANARGRRRCFFDFTFYLWVTFKKKWVIKSSSHFLELDLESQ